MQKKKKRQDNCSIYCSGVVPQLLPSRYLPTLLLNQLWEEELKSIKALKASQFTPISVLSFSGAVLVDLLNHFSFSFFYSYTQTRQTNSKAKAKVSLLLTPQEGDLSPPPPPPTASLLHSLFYLSHNPLIKVQIKESLCSSLWPSISP